jgi:hypothetical protein
LKRIRSAAASPSEATANRPRRGFNAAGVALFDSRVAIHSQKADSHPSLGSQAEDFNIGKLILVISSDQGTDQIKALALSVITLRSPLYWLTPLRFGGPHTQTIRSVGWCWHFERSSVSYAMGYFKIFVYLLNVLSAMHFRTDRQLFAGNNDKSGDGDFHMQISPITNYTDTKLQADTIDNKPAPIPPPAPKSPQLWPSSHIPGESMDVVFHQY